jgi:plastocyanin
MKQAASILLLCVLCGLCFAADKKKDKTHDVSIADMKYDPAKLEIAVGDTVIWTNNDNRNHTVVAKDKSFKSDNLAKGDTFEHKFTKAGTFAYFCSYHPRMKATIVVGGG